MPCIGVKNKSQKKINKIKPPFQSRVDSPSWTTDRTSHVTVPGEQQHGEDPSQGQVKATIPHGCLSRFHLHLHTSPRRTRNRLRHCLLGTLKNLKWWGDLADFRVTQT